MDFMKVLDQTVRDIKREVNLKVLKVPEIEQKVLDATSNEPWGPHGSDLSDIAQNTKKYTECQMIMNVLWTRLNDTGPNWRHVYKALAVVEYLIANGSDRAVDDILECSSKIAAVSSFEYVEPNGKDLGINVRKKAETILGILRDKDKIQQVRNKASANRDKYIGLSSSGITYKSAPSYGGSGFDSDRFGSFGNRKEGDSFRDGYKDEEYSGDGANVSHGGKGGLSKSRGNSANGSEGFKSKKGLAQGVSTPKSSSRPGTDPSKSSGAEPENFQDDFDDFDPRGSSTAGSSDTSANQVDLFGQSLLIDLMDAPTSVPTETVTMNNSVSSESDLFADATFVSAAPQKETTTSSPALSSETDLFADADFVSASSQTETAKISHAQGNINLFANQPAIPSNVDFFAAPVSSLPSETKSKPISTNSNVFDPFAAVPLNNFEGSDSFGDFASHSDPVSKHPLNNSMNDPNTLDKHSSAVSSQPAPKDTFQVKSGIWADSLSRGLIDLNITAPKKTSLADVGVVGGLSDSFDEKEKGPATLSYNYMGRSMGASMGAAGSGIGRTGLTFNQQQFPDFK